MATQAVNPALLEDIDAGRVVWVLPDVGFFSQDDEWVRNTGAVHAPVRV